MIFLGLAENSIQLVPDGTLFLHIAIILLMIYVLNSTLFKPINRILEEREKRTTGRSGEAADVLLRVEQELARYERTLRDARSEGYRLMEQERAEGLRERQVKLDAIREEVSMLLAREKGEIGSQTEEARLFLERESRRLASEIGAHILHRPVSDAVVASVS